MPELWLLLPATVLLVFGLVVFRGAPYLPTHQASIQTALDLAGLKQGQTLLELGAGDGRLVKAAVDRGWSVVGVELNPFLYFLCKWRFRKNPRAKILLGDFRRIAWPDDIDAVYVFGSKGVMEFLAAKLAGYGRPVRVVSYGFKLPGHKPLKKVNGLFLYRTKFSANNH